MIFDYKYWHTFCCIACNHIWQSEKILVDPTMDYDSCPHCCSIGYVINDKEVSEEIKEKQELIINFILDERKGTYKGIFMDYDTKLDKVYITMSGKFIGETIEVSLSKIRLMSYHIKGQITQVSAKDSKQRKAWRKLKGIKKSVYPMFSKIKKKVYAHCGKLGKPTLTFYQRKLVIE